MKNNHNYHSIPNKNESNSQIDALSDGEINSKDDVARTRKDLEDLQVQTIFSLVEPTNLQIPLLNK